MKTGKLIGLLLALALMCASVSAGVQAEIEPEALERMASDVVAEENRAHAGESGAIDAVEITDLDAPRSGAAFDTMATIVGTRSEGSGTASWQTPVIWTDMAGNPVDTARAGVTYMPFITFFVPEGYTLADVDVQKNVNLTLPKFFADATGKNGTLYFLEAPASGLVFITGEITVPDDGARLISRSDAGKRSTRSARTVMPDPQVTLSPEVMVHTNAETVNTYGPEYVGWLIETVKNVIEPRAVNLLIDAFPVYRDALNRGELSSGIGFFVEKQQNTIAYVRCASLVYKDSGKLAGKTMRMVVNADFFAVWDAEKGQYRFDESRRADLEFTITHEILHATMYDYTTNGAMGVDADGAKAPENRFPTWFTEGAATAVDNAYRYRRNALLHLCLDLDRYENESAAAVSFTPDRLIENYRRLANLYNIDGGAGSAEYAYTSGYLASVYLMQLASEHLHDDDHVAGREVYRSGDMREGFNYILGELHGGRSLDQIVRDISPTDAGGKPVYPGLADFQARFLAEQDRDYSAAFCANFLKYLESLSRDGQHSWGCILIDFDDMRETLFTDGDAPVEPLAYRIEDTGEYVKSDVSVADSLGTGGAVLPVESADAGAGNANDALETAPEAEALAAKAGTADGETASTDEPAEVEADEPPAVGEDEPVEGEAYADGAEEAVKDDDPVTENTPEMEDTPKADEKPETEDTPKADEKPETGDTPKADEKPETRDVPKADEKPGTGDTPKADEKSGTGDTPKADEKPGTGDTPKADEKSETREVPKAEEKPGTGDTPKADEKPETRDVPKADESPVASAPAADAVPVSVAPAVDAVPVTDAADAVPVSEAP